MHDQTPDPMQAIFDAAEAAQDALHFQEGLEAALRATLAPVLAARPDQEATIWSLVEGMTNFRASALFEVRKMQAVSMEH